MDNIDGHIWQRGRPYLTVMLGTIYCKSKIYHNGQIRNRKVDGKKWHVAEQASWTLSTHLRYAKVSGTEPWTS